MPSLSDTDNADDARFISRDYFRDYTTCVIRVVCVKKSKYIYFFSPKYFMNCVRSKAFTCSGSLAAIMPMNWPTVS